MRLTVLIVSLTLLQIGIGSSIQAQVPDVNFDTGEQTEKLSQEELQQLVAPIALYPDDLLSVVLAAATYPVQIVQASRFLSNSGKSISAGLKERWDPSVVALLNYPEVLEMMNSDLDWTWKLGTAVANQHELVLVTIQNFRQRAKVAGNLKSDYKQEIIEENQSIVIKSNDPDTICVPEYDPEVVVVRHSYPVIYEYSDPYPIYFYPSAYYPSYWASFFISYGFDWHHKRINRRYHHRKFARKRPFKTRRWKPRYRHIGRPGRKFVRHASVGKKITSKSGDHLRPSKRRRHQNLLRRNRSDQPRLDKLARIKQRDVQSQGQKNKNRKKSSNEVRRIRQKNKSSKEISGDRQNLKRANAPDQPRSKKLARVKERNVQIRGQQKNRMRASANDVSRVRKNRTRVKKKRSRSKLRTVTNPKRQKVRSRVSSKRKIRNQTRRTRDAQKNRNRSVKRTRVHARSARRNVRINRRSTSGDRGRLSVSRTRQPQIRRSRGGNRGNRVGRRG